MNVFISHASADRSYATRIADLLRQAGHSVWTPQEILPGDNWASAVGDALARADALVALISSAALASEAVRREWEFALGQEKFKNRLIPVSIKSVGELPWILGKLQIVRPGSPDAAARAIVERLKPGSTRSPRKSRAAS